MRGFYLIHFEKELRQKHFATLPDDQAEKLTIGWLSCRGLDGIFQIDAASLTQRGILTTGQ